MLDIDNILVPTDFSHEACNSLILAARFAGYLQANLHVLRIIDNHSMSVGDVLEGVFHDEKNADATSRIAAELRNTGWRAELVEAASTHRSRGVPIAKGIIEYARSNGIDLIVMEHMAGVHRSLARIMSQNVIQDVVKGSGIPVFVFSIPETTAVSRRVDWSVMQPDEANVSLPFTDSAQTLASVLGAESTSSGVLRKKSTFESIRSTRREELHGEVLLPSAIDCSRVAPLMP